jgi:hypothetical protein
MISRRVPAATPHGTIGSLTALASATPNERSPAVKTVNSVKTVKTSDKTEKTSGKAVKTSDKAVKKVVDDFEKCAVRAAAREALAAHPIHVENGADLLAVRIIEEKRVLYSLKGRALSKIERAACMKKNAAKIKEQHEKLYSLIADGGWSSLDEVKLYTRAHGLFDAHIVDGKIERK